MSSLRLSTVLLTLVGISMSIRCREGESKKNVVPIGATNCTGKFCMKVKVYNDKNYWFNNYTCGDNECQKDGCTLDKYGAIKCCCSTDMCNTAPAIFTLVSIASMIILKLLM